MKAETKNQQISETKKVRTNAGLVVRSGVKAGGPVLQHNQSKGVRVRSGVKAGGPVLQHNQSKGVRVRSGVKAGGMRVNHNQAIARA